jgi:hypothetical protein
MNGHLHDGQQAGESNGLLHTGWLKSTEGGASRALHLFYSRSLLQLAVHAYFI